MENKKCVKIRKQTAWLKTYVKMVTIIKLTKSIHVLEKGFLKNSQCIKYSTFDSIIPSSFTTILCTERLVVAYWNCLVLRNLERKKIE